VRKHPVVQILLIVAIGTAIGIPIVLAIPWFPAQASAQASRIDTFYNVLLIVSVPIFVGVLTIVLYSVWRFRMKPGEEGKDGPPIHGNTRLEVVWTAAPAILIVALCTYAYTVLHANEVPKPGERTVNVIGEQFAWYFTYPSSPGKSVVTQQLYLPKGQPVVFKIHSRDVIHEFFVPAFRLQLAAVPGITTTLRATPDRLGVYSVVCNQLCGNGHATMRATVHVLTPAAFQAWLTKQPVQPSPGYSFSSAGGGAPAPAPAPAPSGAGNGSATAAADKIRLDEKVLAATRWIGPVLIVFAIIMPMMPFADRQLVDIATLVLTYVMLGWGLNIVVGLAGLLDLGYVAFYAVGAYSYALLATTFGLSFWICLPLAGILAALWGMILGFPVLRLRGDYLAIVTLAFGEIIRLMREGFTRAKRPPRRVLQKSGELPAIAAAISGLEPGDLLLCQVDQVEVALEFVKGLFRQAEARPIVPIAQFAAAALAALGIIGGG